MRKLAAGRRIAATLATASLAGALGLTGSGQAQAAAPEPLNFTVDFSRTSFPQVPTLGAGFAGNGPVVDAEGNQIGTAFDTCAVDGVENATTADVICTVYVKFANGSELDLSTQAPVDVNPFDYPYTFQGVVQGGTGAYDGAQGQATIIAHRPRVYEVVVSFK
ncbi:hypothetical protein [Streptomyces colonosanans]|uniref:Allene oxide cyclase barrel-like domain-containing protein n=1 Tax=Streptomyces colonosanans TaxID=1428652 RepID=A0A1S2PY61_9ACTN|nr:hypothetical protein [Streptomyces colonosanans]OIJ98446.1 hypothetical protein BIV24_06325 [Streptomyces colonosanans]